VGEPGSVGQNATNVSTFAKKQAMSVEILPGKMIHHKTFLKVYLKFYAYVIDFIRCMF
jgi:hypothetical protein